MLALGVILTSSPTRESASNAATIRLDPKTAFPLSVDGRVVDSGCDAEFQPVMHDTPILRGPVSANFRKTATFRVVSGPSRTGGSTRINFGIAVGTRAVPAASAPVSHELFLWLTCAGGRNGDTATGTVRVECPEAGFVQDIPITADFVAAPRAGAMLVLDQSDNMQDDRSDGRTRLQVLLDSAPGVVEAAP